MSSLESSPSVEEAQNKTTMPSLDLRYANVTSVEFKALDNGSYRFNVTLFHDDDGESPNYADAWQVLDLDGNILGTRELLHSHGSRPFTRSHVIGVPDGTARVLVRGHDMLHGYGGQGMLVDLEIGTVSPVDIPYE
jgi:hypothetical protein